MTLTDLASAQVETKSHLAEQDGTDISKVDELTNTEQFYSENI